jgi:hypothetical protein
VNTLGIVAHTTGVQGACTNYDIMSAIERFDWYMQNVPGTQSTISLPALAKMVNAGFNEAASSGASSARSAGDGAERDAHRHLDGLLNPDCSDMQVLINTTDQQGDTIAGLVAAVKEYTSRTRRTSSSSSSRPATWA